MLEGVTITVISILGDIQENRETNNTETMYATILEDSNDVSFTL